MDPEILVFMPHGDITLKLKREITQEIPHSRSSSFSSVNSTPSRRESKAIDELAAAALAELENDTAVEEESREGENGQEEDLETEESSFFYAPDPPSVEDGPFYPPPPRARRESNASSRRERSQSPPASFWANLKRQQSQRNIEPPSTPEVQVREVELTKRSPSRRARPMVTFLQDVHCVVSSRHMMLASEHFMTLLSGDTEEANTLRNIGHVTIPLTVDPDILVILLNIIHGKTREVPRQVSLGTLRELAVMVSDLKMISSVEFFADTWIDHSREELPEGYTEDVLSWLYIFFVFERPEEFKDMSRITERESDEKFGGEEEGGLLPVAVIDAMKQARQSAIETIVNVIHSLIKKYMDGKVHCDSGTDEDLRFACDAMLLGSLMKGSSKIGIWPRPENPFPGKKFNTLAAEIRKIKMVDVCGKGSGRRWSSYGGFERNCHGLEDQIGSIIKAVEGGLQGLELEDYKKESGGSWEEFRANVAPAPAKRESPALESIEELPEVEQEVGPEVGPEVEPQVEPQVEPEVQLQPQPESAPIIQPVSWPKAEQKFEPIVVESEVLPEPSAHELEGREVERKVEPVIVPKIVPEGVSPDEDNMVEIRVYGSPLSTRRQSNASQEIMSRPRPSVLDDDKSFVDPLEVRREPNSPPEKSRSTLDNEDTIPTFEEARDSFRALENSTHMSAPAPTPVPKDTGNPFFLQTVHSRPGTSLDLDRATILEELEPEPVRRGFFHGRPGSLDLDRATIIQEPKPEHVKKGFFANVKEKVLPEMVQQSPPNRSSVTSPTPYHKEKVYASIFEAAQAEPLTIHPAIHTKPSMYQLTNTSNTSSNQLTAVSTREQHNRAPSPTPTTADFTLEQITPHHQIHAELAPSKLSRAHTSPNLGLDPEKGNRLIEQYAEYPSSRTPTKPLQPSPRFTPSPPLASPPKPSTAYKVRSPVTKPVHPALPVQPVQLETKTATINLRPMSKGDPVADLRDLARPETPVSPMPSLSLMRTRTEESPRVSGHFGSAEGDVWIPNPQGKDKARKSKKRFAVTGNRF